MMKIINVIFASLCLATITLASELPSGFIPQSMGVNIHFVTGHTHDLDLIAAGGFKFIRMDFAWNAIERQKGEYDWSAYDELTRHLEKRSLSAIYILDYSNSLYEEKVESRNAQKTDRPQRDTASPQHPESIAAYTRWAAAVQHFHGHHIVWEIWNEPNGFFWKPKPDAVQYTALALSAAQAIRAADSQATIIGPALSGFQPPFMETFLKSGILQYLDGVSVHPYRNYKHGPETAGADYAKLRAQIGQFASSDQQKYIPIISGEWGYSTNIKGVSLETQAAYLVRQQLANLMNGVPLSIWYDWQNDGTDASEVEHNFGTVTFKLAPKPAYLAAKVLAQQLNGCHFKMRLNPQGDDYLLEFRGANGLHLAAWTTAEPHTVSVSFGSPNGVSCVNGMGESRPPKFENRHLSLDLDSLPKYITAR